MSTQRVSTFRHIVSESDVRASFRLIKQLRPHLSSEDEFWLRWQRQTGEGYILDGLFIDDVLVALAGYRIQENLVHGRFFYVEDLVTSEEQRSCGYGESMMSYLSEQARSSGCGKLVLDTPLSNSLGHRFYFRCGLLATSLRFNIPVES
ncbi:GNAT family N-acetyltransferase [Lonsdalea quercina]|uniref:GNAT family N-acetyltransferase n=1 Tax=Lonsdalea quercina TaxID=71657 RepID=UPI003976AC1E